MKVGLIGCGMIAGELDDPGSPHVLTHAKAISLHPKFTLAACCDPDRARALALAEKWDCPGVFSDLEEMAALGLDAFVVAASSGAHFGILKTLLSWEPDLIICEKPLVEELDQLDDLEGLLSRSRTRVLVNFQRRFDPALGELKRIVAGGELGEACFFQGAVGKGLIHNGCHLLDLVSDLLGPVTSLEPIRFRKAGGDLLGSFEMGLGSGVRGLVQNTDRVEYGLLDLEIMFSRGRASIRELGYRLQVEKKEPWEMYPGFFRLNPQPPLKPTLNRVFFELYEAVAQGRIDYPGLLADALAGTRLLLKLKERCG